MTGGGNGNNNANGNGNNNANGNENNNANGNNNGNGNVNNNTNDNGGSDDDCAGVDLTGTWTQDANSLDIVQTGANVTSTFDEPFDCDPEDGGDIVSESEDFQATVDGCNITGTINVCRFGCDEDSDFECGIVPLDMTGVINASGDRFEIDVSDDATGDSITLIYNRQS